nr:NAD(P)/FAD-dependent oxidoreductase [Sinimarinibacterium sp. NLF-5-8]
MTMPVSSRRRARQVTPAPTPTVTLDALIIGAGFAGLGSAIRLRQAGVSNIAILERGAEVGGTWRDNQYPGAACDIPSHLYSYSFAPNPDWSRGYSGSREILAYVQHLVSQFALDELIHFQRNVTGMAYDEARGVWTVSTEQGQTYTARSVVMAGGPLSNASLPNMAGIETYKGHKIHSARWDHAYDFTGKRVGVIGTGASGIQIIPELVKTAAKVTVFQRTPGWVLPRLDFAQPGWIKRLFRRLPIAQSAVRGALYDCTRRWPPASSGIRR